MIFLLITRPYDVGDRVQIGDVSSTDTFKPSKQWVQSINLTTTTFRSTHNKVMIVPNFVLSALPITNLKVAIHVLSHDHPTQLRLSISLSLSLDLLFSSFPCFVLMAFTPRHCRRYICTLTFLLCCKTQKSPNAVFEIMITIGFSTPQGKVDALVSKVHQYLVRYAHACVEAWTTFNTVLICIINASTLGCYAILVNIYI